MTRADQEKDKALFRAGWLERCPNRPHIECDHVKAGEEARMVIGLDCAALLELCFNCAMSLLECTADFAQQELMEFQAEKGGHNV